MVTKYLVGTPHYCQEFIIKEIVRTILYYELLLLQTRIGQSDSNKTINSKSAIVSLHYTTATKLRGLMLGYTDFHSQVSVQMYSCTVQSNWS